MNSIILYSAMILLAIGLTLLSLRFVRPLDCRGFCDAPKQESCPDKSCRAGEQRAGIPLPVLVDDPGGGSPMGGWGILGPEDLPNPMTFILDVLFYSIVLWLLWSTIQAIRGETNSLQPLPVTLALAVVLGYLLVGFFLYRPLLAR